MTSIGEPYKGTLPIESVKCSCGLHVLECPFFTQLERRVRELGNSFSLRDWQVLFRSGRSGLLNFLLERPLPSVFMERVRNSLVSSRPEFGQNFDVVGRHVYHLALAALEITGKQVFVDTEKDPMRIKFLSRLPELDLKVLHLVRDVRGAVASFLKKRRGRGPWPRWSLRSLDVAQATLWWRFINMNSERALRFVEPDRSLRIRYDDLCSDPQGTIDVIADFVGVPRRKAPLNFFLTSHHILGNTMRLRGANAGTVKHDDSWKSSLQDRDLEIVARIAGRTSHYFGFTWPPLHPR
jgi:hypothetical protein